MPHVRDKCLQSVNTKQSVSLDAASWLWHEASGASCGTTPLARAGLHALAAAEPTGGAAARYLAVVV